MHPGKVHPAFKFDVLLSITIAEELYFDPSRLGGRGAAGRQRDRTRAAEGRLLAERIHRLTAELERRDQLRRAVKPPYRRLRGKTE
ncbi:hypothetical protein P3T23_009729 [Paraburkholderia sp. GAS448]